MSANFQLAVELTNLFPVREIASQAYHRILGFARDLKRSGSDFVVEEDLAATFGRGQIDQEMEKRFKTDILRDTHVHPLHRNSEVCLDTRPGPTINRAVTDPDRYYMSTIVQLSLLGWVHARMGLASALADCMNKRFDMELPEARPNPGYEGIFGMLEACSSQTSNFNWNNYIRSVEDRLGPQLVDFERRRWFLCLRPETLLAAMDYLYIIQKFPEDRKMIINNHEGILTMVVWAYYVLNLTVLVKGSPAGDVSFGKDTLSPQVIILWDEPAGHEICLLDKNTEVVLRTEEDELTFSYLEACERLPLQNYGTILLHRHFNRYISASQDDPIYIDAAQMVVAMAVVASRNLIRTSSAGTVLSDHGKRGTRPPIVLERWRITAFANILFKDLSLDVKAIDGFVDALLEDEEADSGTPLPRSLELHLKKLKKPTQWTQGVPTVSLGLLRRLASLIVVFSNISGAEHSAVLPLNSDLSQLGLDTLGLEIRNPVIVHESKFLNLIFRMLIGNRRLDQGSAQELLDHRTFLISDFGWSVFLSSVGDLDPGSVQPELLFLRKGIPTKLRTGERRSLIRDTDRGLFSSSSMQSSMVPERKILDKGPTYVPRSIYSVDHRTEYYGVLKDEFQLNIRFGGQELRPVQQMTSGMRARFEGKQTGKAFFEDSLDDMPQDPLSLPTQDETSPHFVYDTSYRHLHQCLWEVLYTPPCDHATESRDQGAPNDCSPGKARYWSCDRNYFRMGR